MAAVIYPKYKEALLGGAANIDLSGGNVKAVFVNVSGAGTLYTYAAGHDFLDDVPAASRIATSGNLTGKTITDGKFDAADTVVTNTDNGTTVEALIIYIDTGAEGTSRLVCYIDSGTGIPFTTNGNNINLNFNASGIFDL